MAIDAVGVEKRREVPLDSSSERMREPTQRAPAPLVERAFINDWGEAEERLFLPLVDRYQRGVGGDEPGSA